MTDFFAQNQELLGTLAMVVLMIVALGLASEMFRRWLTHKERMATALNAQAAEKAAQYAARSERLEARVQVLERIATDGGARLSDDIERLRDLRAVN